MSLHTFKPVVWSTQLEDDLRNVHVYKECCNTDHEGEIKSRGDTVQVNSLGAVTISDYTDAAGLSDPENVHGAGASMTIDQQKSFNFKVPDIDKAQANVALMGGYTEVASWGLGDAVDLFISAMMATAVPTANKLNGGTTYVVGPGAGDTDLYQLIIDLEVKLDEANCPSGGRWIALPPSAYGVLQKDDRFVNFGTDKNRAAARGEDLGQVGNFMIKKTNNCPSTGSGSSKVWTILAGSKIATSYAEQVTETIAYRPEKSFSDALKGLLTYGGHVFKPYCLASAYVNIAPTQ